MFLNNLYKIKSLSVLISLILIVAFFIFFQSLYSLKINSNKIIEKSIEISQSEKKKELENYVTLAYKTLESYYSRTAKDKIKNEVKLYTEEQSNYLFSIIEAVYENKKENLSIDELKKEIITIIKNARYGKSGYFWINDFDYKMIMHPIKKELMDKYFKNNSEVPFVELGVDSLNKNNKDFAYIEYPFFNPSSKKTVFKSSLVRVFKPFNWIIGTGSYVDDVAEDIKKNAIKSIAQMKYSENGYFWIINSKYELILDQDDILLKNKNMFDKKNQKGEYIYQEIVKIANKNKEGGFFKYFWTKPNTEVEFEKLSFVKKFEPWDFIIGTGIYTDEIKNKNTSLKESENEVLPYVIEIIILFTMMIFLVTILLINIKKQKRIESELKIKTNELDYLNKNLEEKILLRTNQIKNQKLLLQKIIDSEVNMMIVTDFKTVSLMNESSLNFFTLDNKEEFSKRFPNFLDIFCEYGDYLHKGLIKAKVKEDLLGNEFYKLVKTSSEEKRVVVLLDSKLEAKTFYLNIILLDKNKNLFLISLTDITKLTIAKNITEKEAYFDELTNVPNRNSLKKEFEKELQRAKRYKTPLSLAILDIDYFKKFNDNYGHLIGDEVLIMMANECKSKIRKTDFFARWGGEEFVILFPQTNIKEAVHSANKIRIDIENLEHSIAGKVTCSMGVTEYCEGDDIKSLFKRCDEALYKAKASGRNNVQSS